MTREGRNAIDYKNRLESCILTCQAQLDIRYSDQTRIGKLCYTAYRACLIDMGYEIEIKVDGTHRIKQRKRRFTVNESK